MNDEFKLFNDLMRSERCHKKDQRRVAAKFLQSVDFTAFVKEWTIHVHPAAAENQDKIKSTISFQNNHQAWVNTQGENNTLRHRKNERAIYKNCNLKRTRDKKRRAQNKEVCFIKIFLITSHFLPKKVQARERRKKVQCNWYVNMDVLCIFILFKELSDKQAESNIPDLV